MKNILLILILFWLTSCRECVESKFEIWQPIKIEWKGTVVEGKIISIYCGGDILVEFNNKYGYSHVHIFSEGEIVENK